MEKFRSYDNVFRSSIAVMTWLEAAEYILSLEGPEMHIRDLTDRIMKLNMVNSSCKTSLETLLYRQTHKVNSKFERVPSKMGWFRLKEQSSIPCAITDDEPLPKDIIIKQRTRKRCKKSDQSDSSELSSLSDSSDDEFLYHKKYYYLKSLAKRLIMANVSLAGELESVQTEIEKSLLEKKYLIQRLLNTEERQTSKKVSKVKNVVSSAVTKPISRKTREIIKTPRPKLPLTPPTKQDSSFSSDSEAEDELKKIKTKHPSSDGIPRKKRMRRVQPVALDDNGIPVLPIRIGGLQVHSLGKVVWERPAFHSERYIWPVGFESTRAYPSMIDPSKRCTYICRIVDGGEAPIFEMASEESPNKPIQATSATACHHAVLKAINEARDKQATNAGSGPEFFGFSHPTILNLIQDMMGAEKCTKYKRTDFLIASRGKQQTTTIKSKAKKQTNRSKAFYKSTESPIMGDPSLAPVVINRQLSSLQRDSFSDSSLSDRSEHDLIIDAIM